MDDQLSFLPYHLPTDNCTNSVFVIAEFDELDIGPEHILRTI